MVRLIAAAVALAATSLASAAALAATAVAVVVGLVDRAFADLLGERVFRNFTLDKTLYLVEFTAASSGYAGINPYVEQAMYDLELPPGRCR